MARPARMLVGALCALSAVTATSCQAYSVAQMHGRFDAFQDHSVPDLTIEFRDESHEKPLKGILGASLFDEVDCQGHCGDYLYTGVRYDFPFEGPIDAGIGLAFGSYHSGGIDLGSSIIARPGVDVAIPLGKSVQFGGFMHHFTSGPWGEDDPGAESIGIMLNWSF